MEHGAMEQTALQPSKQNNDDDDNALEKETKLDTSSKALTDEFKKGLKDETIVQVQTLADDSVQEKVSAIEALKEAISKINYE